jgi:replicative DNA helicase
MHFENDMRTRAEKLVLCALMLDNGSIHHIGTLKPAHFSHDTHGQIFKHIVKLIAMNEPADACTVFSSMDRCRQLRRAGLFSYLCEISKLPAAPARIGIYACALTDESQLVTLAIRLVPVKAEHVHRIDDSGHNHCISDPGHSRGAPRIWFGLDLATDR